MRAIAHSLLFLTASFALADTPPDVVAFLRSTAAALASAHDSNGRGLPDAGPFLDKFDRDMPGFVGFRDEIEALVARAEVGSAIEIVSDQGDENKRTLELDWVLEIQDQRPRRRIVKCTMQRVKRDWKITAIEPLDFFKYD